jgi:predicted DNA-binding transcriptional regulator AlpA
MQTQPPRSTSRIPFPQPEKINNRNYWRLRSLRQWDAERNGSVAESGADDEALLTSKQVCARYGGVSTMCLWRWMRDDQVTIRNVKEAA